MLENRNTRRLSSAGKTTNTNSSTHMMEPLSVAMEGCDPLTLFAKQDANIDPLSRICDEFVSLLNSNCDALLFYCNFFFFYRTRQKPRNYKSRKNRQATLL